MEELNQSATNAAPQPSAGAEAEDSRQPGTSAAAAAAPEAAPAPHWYAQLDAEGVYRGQVQMESPGLQLLEANVIDLGEQPCDLAPGRYKWNAEKKHFHPIIDQKPAEAPLDVTATNILARLVRDLDAAKVPLSEPVKKWFADYSRTFDFN